MLGSGILGLEASLPLPLLMPMAFITLIMFSSLSSFVRSDIADELPGDSFALGCSPRMLLAGLCCCALELFMALGKSFHEERVGLLGTGFAVRLSRWASFLGCSPYGLEADLFRFVLKPPKASLISFDE